MSQPAIEALERYAFPGNVRELENILERAMTLCDGNVIGAPDLAIQEEYVPSGQADDGADDALDAVLESVEKQTIMNALEQARWNKTAAAKLLGISFGALRYRMQKLGLD